MEYTAFLFADYVDLLVRRNAHNPPTPPPPLRYNRRWAKVYSRAWELATVIVTAIMVYTEYWVYLAKDSRVTFMTNTLTAARVVQCVIMVSDLINQSFNPTQYLVLLGFFTTWGFIVNLVIWRERWNEDPEIRPVRDLLAVYFWSHHLFCLVDISCRHILLHYRAELTVAEWLESSLWRDSFQSAGNTLTFTEMKISNFWSELPRRFWWRQGVITLPDDNNHTEAQSAPWAPPTQLHHDVFHWSSLVRHSGTQKALWITADSQDINACASDVFQLLLATDTAVSIDVSETGSVLRPLLHALGTAWPEFKRQLATYTTHGMYSLQHRFESEGRFNTFISKPLENIWNDNRRKYSGDPESQQQVDLFLLKVAIHGIRDTTQAWEVYRIIQCLPAQHSSSLAIVVISTPDLFHPVSKHRGDIMELVYTLSLSKKRTVIYSGNPPILPWFNQNLFRLVLEGIFRSADEVSERLWAALNDRAASSISETPNTSDDLSHWTQSTLAIFRLLHKISDISDGD